MKVKFLILLFPVSVFCQDISESYIDSIITKTSDGNYGNFKTLLRQVNMLSSENSLDKFNYITSKVQGNDSLVIYTQNYHISTLMRFGKNQKALQLSNENIALAAALKSPYFQYENFQLRANIFDNLSKIDSMAFYVNKTETIISENPEELGHHMARVYMQRALIEQALGNSGKEDYYIEEVAKVVQRYPNKNMTYDLSMIVYHFKSKKNYLKHAFYSQMLREYYIKREGVMTPKTHESLSSMLKMDNTKEQLKELKLIAASNDSLQYKNYQIQTLNTIGIKLREINRFNEDIEYLEKSLDKNTFNVINLYSKLVSYENLYKCYYSISDYKKAADILLKLNEVQNSIRQQETLDKIAEIEVQFETQKKVAEVDLLKTENENQKLKSTQYAILATGGVIVALLLGFFGYKNHLKNKKLASQKLKLEHALDEKNVLLKEIHHRVKNSFQIVSSLLYLQSENIEDEDAKLAIKEAENRVRSMVLIHQKLYNKDELVGVNTKEYIHDLVNDIFESHQFKDHKINYELNVEPIVLDIETITPIGLILNELIVNTLKHAFDSVTEASNLTVDFGKHDNQLVLKVSDNGKGFEGKPSQSSFGIKLINALSKKLKAQLDYTSSKNQGTEALLGISKFNIIS